MKFSPWYLVSAIPLALLATRVSTARSSPFSESRWVSSSVPFPYNGPTPSGRDEHEPLSPELWLETLS